VCCEVMVYFVENLTLRAWLFSVLPRLIRRRIEMGYHKAVHCYVIDGSWLTMRAASATGWVAGVCVEKFTFRLVELRDEAGLQIRFRIAHQDLAEVQADIMKESVFHDFVNSEERKDRLAAYLAKSIVTISWSDRGSLWRALLLVQICAWKTRDMKVQRNGATLFLERRPWSQTIARYGSRCGIRVIPVGPAPSFEARAMIRRILGPKGVVVGRMLRDRFRGVFVSLLRKQKDNTRNLPRTMPVRRPVAVEYYGHFNLNHPERYSDLFFWQQSPLSGSDILITFALSQDPVDEQKWTELTHHEIAAVALNPGATTVQSTPLFTHWPRLLDGSRKAIPGKSLEAAWMREHISNYHTLREYWTSLFAAYGVKVYISWYMSDWTHCAIADALESLGGVLAIYQRSLELLPTVELAVAADIVFSYSSKVADVNRLCGSSIRYHVVTGYLGDHRFSLLRENAPALRNTLRRSGATRILAFFDENSHDDERWLLGHTITRENYAFLLNKVLEHPWLGLLIKPKAPATLRRRLGPVSELLRQAQATGRCYMYEAGALQGSDTPAAAALASDLAIHGHLCGATAGLEAALTGVPTLLMDREGWSVSPLYQLGIGRVVFTDWQELWKALIEHWASPTGIPGFGDWSPMLDELDPFRDGRAAERMGIYIKWLVEGFKAGLDRYTVMADAAERYCGMWGKDKVTEINSKPWPGSGSRRYEVGKPQPNISGASIDSATT